VRLADCFIEVLAYAKLYLRRPGADYDAFRARVLAQLEDSRTRALAAGFANEDYQSALFAVVAWIDEAVMTSNWAGTARWKKELLQQAFFSTARAGVEFFKRMDEIAGHQQAVREVYYFCLMLGFKGRYVTKAQEKTLDELKQHHVALLVRDARNFAVDGASALFPQAYPSSEPAAPAARAPSFLKTTLLVLAVPVAVLLVMYFSYDQVLGGMTSGFSVFIK
jgi:type VI secretion system protein ImpK